MSFLAFRAKAYLRYRLRARSIQYIHSPFLFALMGAVFPDRHDPAFDAIERLRKALRADHRKLPYHDLGAPSHVSSAAERSVSEIAAAALQRPRYARFLHRFAKYTAAAETLELGTSLGITTMYLATASRRVTTIEGHAHIAAVAAQNFSSSGIASIRQLTGNFDELLVPALQEIKKADLVFIDGNHRLEPTLRYFKQVLPHLHERSAVIFDDIHWSPEMQDAWQQIRNHPSVTLSVDLFQFGIVFFNPDLSREHFVLRY